MRINEMDARKLLFERKNPDDTLDLQRASLHNTDWTDEEFRHVNFRGVHFNYGVLRRCVFVCCDLTDASFYNADLREAQFYRCTFDDTIMDCADLRDVKFLKSDTSGIIANAGTAGFWPVCPVEGAFIGWKWADDCLVKLRIPEDARRSSGTCRKCRCDKAEVLEITKDGEPVEVTFSDHDYTFMYLVGEIVEEPKYDPDRWKTCAPGIHFFMTKEEAENYGRH